MAGRADLEGVSRVFLRKVIEQMGYVIGNLKPVVRLWGTHDTLSSFHRLESALSKPGSEAVEMDRVNAEHEHIR